MYVFMAIIRGLRLVNEVVEVDVPTFDGF